MVDADLDRLVADSSDGDIVLNGSAQVVEVTTRDGNVASRKPLSVTDSFLAESVDGNVAVGSPTRRRASSRPRPATATSRSRCHRRGPTSSMPSPTTPPRSESPRPPIRPGPSLRSRCDQPTATSRSIPGDTASLLPLRLWSLLRSQATLKERGQLVEGDEVHAVVEVDVAGAGTINSSWLGGEPVGVLAELLEWAWSPVMNSIGRGEIVSMSLNG